ncbi:MAG TPA: protein kinase [Polyangiaceae bacterium LLY-WYZ-15_(1-7)]|nr:hypothetical protein [Myxococcales bacterium]MAT27716.1 hypothetical protein [Sandaracinus sp.]HJK91019.1 protein kinase [Polyangiaceae bacterium LLY-WYZ-15_(1-7)]HJK99974.1 protein kinase [Polyangiaceae bacterium LLY-WYZ-15_(1-7)]HJL10346.1 protein kinase [Polyangiaceae bacterium LLY-WYZ-15_(1-7)]
MAEERIGKYALGAALGTGGSGAVHRGIDTVLGRPVALKLLHPQLVHDAAVLARFRAEAEAMARLNHPNVVTVHDFAGAGKRWAIVMELVEGGETLASVLAREGRLAPERAARLLADVARGLGHAHARGIVHRDVKPANVLVVRDGHRERAKVTDFGIARLVDKQRMTADRTTLGTLYYMAPEQAGDSAVDARADLYSFGVTAYEVLTGSVPFRYESAPRLLRAHLEETPAPPSAMATGIPPTLDRLVSSLLAKRPEDRPPSADAVADALEALGATGTPSGELAYAPTVAAPSGAPPRPSAPSEPGLGAAPRQSSQSLPATRSSSAEGLASPRPSNEQAAQDRASRGPSQGRMSQGRMSQGGTSQGGPAPDDGQTTLWIAIGAVVLFGVVLFGSILGACFVCHG